MTPRLTPGAWLRRVTDRWELVNVTTVTQSGTVHLQLLDGTHTSTTIGYLRDRFERADDGV